MFKTISVVVLLFLSCFIIAFNFNETDQINENVLSKYFTPNFDKTVDAVIYATSCSNKLDGLTEKEIKEIMPKMHNLRKAKILIFLKILSYHPNISSLKASRDYSTVTFVNDKTKSFAEITVNKIHGVF